MAVVIDQDLTYLGSDLVSAFNPNVLLFHSSTSSAETEATAEVDLKYQTDIFVFETITFDAVMLEKVGSLFYFKLDITDILPSLLNPLTIPSNEVLGLNNSSLESYDYRDMMRSLEITIRIQIPSLSLETSTPYDILACRSVNQIGDEGGSNLYSIYDLATRPTYHIWDGGNSQLSIYIRDNEEFTNINFSRIIDDISEEDTGAGWFAISVDAEMGDPVGAINSGDSVDRQTIEMTFNDDGGDRYADIVIHRGCEDGLNVRYLSRDYGIRYWQFNRIYQQSNKYVESGRVINNINDMNAETRRENTIGIESTPSIDCIYPKANTEEQLQIKQIYSSPQVEALINGVWVGVFPSGSHTINTKREFQDVSISFELPKEYTQRP